MRNLVEWPRVCCCATVLDGRRDCEYPVSSKNGKVVAGEGPSEGVYEVEGAEAAGIGHKAAKSLTMVHFFLAARDSKVMVVAPPPGCLIRMPVFFTVRV